MYSFRKYIWFLYLFKGVSLIFASRCEANEFHLGGPESPLFSRNFFFLSSNAKNNLERIGRQLKTGGAKG